MYSRVKNAAENDFDKGKKKLDVIKVDSRTF